MINSVFICIKLVGRHPNDAWKKSYGDARIMKFYGCPENLILMYFKNLLLEHFQSIVWGYHQKAKTI